MKEIKRTNPYSGQSALLTLEEAKLYDKVKQDEIDEEENLSGQQVELESTNQTQLSG